MRTMQKAALGATAALAALSGAFVPSASAAPAPAPAASADPTATVVRAATADASAQACAHPIQRWGHWGCMKGSNTGLDVDWDGNGSRDETFVIGTNRGIYHIWANAGGWKEMPGGGRADQIWGVGKGPGYRCVGVWAGNTVYANVFHDGKWHNWERGTC
ncbi:MAG: hypothetical protein WCD21_29050 [Streptomyces sp.]